MIEIAVDLIEEALQKEVQKLDKRVRVAAG